MKSFYANIPQKLLQYLSFLFIVAFLPKYALAQPLLTESFNYTSGGLLTANNWTNLAGAGTNNIAVSAGNLSFPGSIADNIGNKVALANNGQDVYRTFTGTNATVYSSLVVNVSAAQAAGDYFYALGYSTSLLYGAKLYIRSNGAGFSFGVLRGGATTPVYESTVRPFSTDIYVVLKYEVVAGATNDAVSVYVNPSPLGSEPGIADAVYNAATGNDISATYTLSSVSLTQGTAANAPTLQLDGINVGTSWASVTTAQYDYGDLPATYETTKDGVFAPAVHAPLANLSLGSIAPDVELAPASVAALADNNSPNGDGVDEDALVIPAAGIRKGSIYSLQVPVSNNAAATRYLYGWIDFNNDGRFQESEMANAVISFSTNGTSTQTLTWSAVKTATLANDITKVYLRLRLSSQSLNDFTTAASGGAIVDERSIGNGAASTTNPIDFGTVAYGEVEDYQLDVIRTYEYGDLPVSFEQDKDGNFLPAMHSELAGFRLGNLLDLEPAPASVNSPNENNQDGDNESQDADEDGVADLNSVSRNADYVLTVSVTNPTAATKYLYGWLDINGDGRFQLDEVVTTTLTAIGTANYNLTWPAAKTNLITSGTKYIYLRLRLSDISLVDFTGTPGGAIIDERSVGNGATVAASNPANALAVANGEVEDYQLRVDDYDFGDAPLSYEMNAATPTPFAVPARHTALPSRFIGSLVDNESVAANVPANTDNNDDNGDGADEDGLLGTLPVIRKGVPFSFSVPVTVSVASNIIAWIDFNNNGRFEANEVAYVASGSGTSGYQTVAVGTSTRTFWFRGTQTNTIPDTVSNVYVRIRLTQTAGADNLSTSVVDERSIGDGLSTGIYGAPTLGEVEDYRFSVIKELDYGDAPVSYDMDKDGLANPANFKPARHFTTDNLYLGQSYILESGPASVATGADNNAPNGDGEEEDGLSANQLFIRTSVNNTFTIALNNTTGSAATLFAWLDVNNDGRFQTGEHHNVAAGTSIPNGASTATITFTSAQVGSIPDTINKVYMRIRLLQANASEGTIGDITAGANNLVVDERAIADGLNTGLYSSVPLGEVEDYQLTVIKDYGDAPVSYENNAPASQSNASPIPVLSIGATVDYELINHPVASGADNNGTNGDGADEDGIVTPQTVLAGAPFSITIPVNTTVSGDKYLYGWIDFNGDGIFNVSEASVTSPTINVTAGTTGNYTLTWNSTNVTPAVLAAGKTYARFRLSGTSISNSNTTTQIDQRSYGRNTGDGEIEDYQFLVSNLYDYGDAPSTYDSNAVTPTAVFLPARQAASATLRLGATVDSETSAHSVASGANNNGTSGDGTDEDGITNLYPIYSGIPYRTQVSVYNNSGAARNLYGWIDFNNNGRFEASEMATIVSVPSSASQQTVTLSWPSATITASNVYMRLRISESPTTSPNMTDGASTTVDERSIGDGLSTGVYGVLYNGEIEDYRLTVATTYDYGDAGPATYEQSRSVSPAFAPARQAISQGLYLGQLPADAEAAKQVLGVTASGDDATGTDDEDGATPDPVIVGATNYSVNVTVTNNSGAQRTLYGWIDFNKNGRFEAGELNSNTANVANNTNNGIVTLTWSNAIIGTIPAVPTPDSLYMRLRISEATLTDFTGGVPGDFVDERALADGINTGEYATTPIIGNGEIEDYTIKVITDLDFGDAPVSYEWNNLNTPVPARQASSATLRLGATVDTESGPHSVLVGNSNNGSNGDGADEDGISTLAPIYNGVPYRTRVSVFNNTGTARTLFAWIDFNNDGRFALGELASVSVPNSTSQQTVTLIWTTAPAIPVDVTNVYMRLRISEQPSMADNSGTSAFDERSIADGATAGTYGALYGGEIEDYQLTVINNYDYGDAAPATYDQNLSNNYFPARQAISPTLFLGQLSPDAESAKRVSGTTANGDDTDMSDDEDGAIPTPVTPGMNNYTLIVNATNFSGADRTLYGWIDFNNNGRFENTAANLEVATVTVPNNTNNGSFTLTWNRVGGTATIPTSPAPDSLYMRLRISESTTFGDAANIVLDERSIADGANSGVNGTVANGEIEDYRIAVNTSLDYGDAAPETYDQNSSNVFVPARQAVSQLLYLGQLPPDIEPAKQVLANTASGDDAGGIDDEDGVNAPAITPGMSSYSVTVTATNNSGAPRILYGWIDFNNNGRFENTAANLEVASVSVPNGTTNGQFTLTWNRVGGTANIPISPAPDSLYMRLRISEATLSDLTTNTVLDERAIGDGTSSPATEVLASGEIEDHRIRVNTSLDYGDAAPVTYDQNASNAYAPARQALTPLLYLGQLPPDIEPDKQVVGLTASGDDVNGVDDEDGANPSPITRGLNGGYTTTVTVTNNSGATRTLYGWIDFNNNGRFESANEMASVTVPNGTNNGSYNLTWTTAATLTIPTSPIPDSLYMRLRISESTTMGDAADATLDERSISHGGATLANDVLSGGEIEDYRVAVNISVDYGDAAPATYDQNQSGTFLPARQAPSTLLYLGQIPADAEPAKQVSGTTASGDDASGVDDEDGVVPLPITPNMNGYSVSVNVTNNSGATRTLWGWIDFNNNGRFEATNESASITVPNGTNNGSFPLTWSAAATATIPTSPVPDSLYMRLRISESPSFGDAANALLDERAIADGVNDGQYGILYAGEVEDHRILVTTSVDYGDAAPATYEQNLSNVSVPARHTVSQLLYLGQRPPDIEPAKRVLGITASGDDADNIDDEDGVIPGSVTVGAGGYSVNVTVTNNSGAARILYGWVDFNNNGRFENTAANPEVASISVPNGTNNGVFPLTWSTLATTTIPTGTIPDSLYMRLRISESAVFGDAANAILDERSIADGANTGVNGTIYGGEVEDYRIRVTTDMDYGDAPRSYDEPGGVYLPARHIPSTALQIGGTPDAEPTAHNVSAASDNNGLNGDGADEDGIDPSLYSVKVNTAFTLPVRVTNTTATARLLHGWLDVNNNGIFESTELATVNVGGAITNGTVNLTWTAAALNQLASPYVYLRLRLGDAAFTDNGTTAYDERAYADGFTNGVYAVAATRGEVEDYRLTVSPTYDYGDVPSTFEINNSSISVPARHLPTATLYLGADYDLDVNAQSVAPGADNNTPNGDGADENGVVTPLVQLNPGGAYSVSVSVFKNVAGTGTIHAWIDMNGDGRFSADEYTSTAVTASTGAQTATVNWTAVPYSGTNNYTYMRLRFTTGTLTDNAATTSIDERSIGDGLSSGIYGSAVNGEVEDYFIPVNLAGTEAQVAACTGLGSINAIQAGFHATLVRPAAGGYVVFGELANGDGVTHITTPAKIETGSSNFNFKGQVRMATLGSTSAFTYHQYFLLTTAGLYAWGTRGTIVSTAVTSSPAMQPISLPPGISPADIKMIDAGASYWTTGFVDGQTNTNGSLAILTNSGEVWIRSSVNAANITSEYNAVQGDGNLLTNNGSTDWHRVETSEGVPLTGMLDVRSTGAAAVATNGTQFYTWGRNVFLGDGTPAAIHHYATLMTNPSSISLPVKQVDIGYGGNISTSYYLLDNQGVVHVMGNNNEGQLGIGNTVAQPSWTRITQKNEEPEGGGNEVDVTTAIGRVLQISSNNHDAFYGHMILITEDKRAYHAGSNSGGGGMSGTVAPTTFHLPTAMTISGGTSLLPGRIVIAEAGGHIGILGREGSDRYGYVGHTVSGSDGCNGCTNSPSEYNFDLTTSTGPLCGIEAFDYGDLDERYNLKDSARHQILYAQISNPLKLGAIAADSDDGPAFNTSGSSNNADGDDTDGDGDDEDAFITLPVKTAGAPYSINVPLTNNTGGIARLYGFIDWDNNGTFTPNEAATANVNPSASQQSIMLTWADPGIAAGSCVDVLPLRSFVRLRLTTTVLVDNTNTPADERSHLAAGDGEVEDYYLDWYPIPNQADLGNLPTEGGGIIWKQAKASLTALDLSATRVWLGDNNSYPTEPCASNVARNGGLTISRSGLALGGTGTSVSPILIPVATPYSNLEFNVTVNGNGAPNTPVYYGIWFDADGNGSFTDAGDVFTSGMYQHGSPRTTTIPFQLYQAQNANATNGAVRVVATAVNTTFTKGQNGEVSVENGEVEDYYVQYLFVVNGNIFNDANSNTIIDSGENLSSLPVPLYVYLVDNNGIVVDSAHVAPDGSYSLDASPNQDYTVELSQVQYPVGTNTVTTPVDHTPPAGWVTTGENGNGSSDGTPDGVLSVSVGTTPASNQNFGIQQPPVTVDDSSDDNPYGSPVTVDILSNDTDDTPGNIDQTTVSIVPPSGATGIITDSEGDTIGFTVPGQGVWTVDTVTGLVTFVPEPGFTGDPTPIAYTVEDNGGYPSNPATITVTYSDPVVITGTVFNDANGNTTTEGGEDFTTLPVPLYVYLVDNNGIVVDSAQVQPDGSYTLNAGPNQDYTVELSTVEYPVGTNTATTPIDHTPPAGWVTTGENADGSNDGIPDGVLSVSVGTTPVSNTNFGIQQPPVANDDLSEDNPYGTPVTVDVLYNDTDDTPGDIDLTTVSIIPPVGATGLITDSQGDTIGFTVPGEGTWSVDTTTGSVTFVPEPGFNGNPAPVSYTVSDNGGYPSNPATITIIYDTPVVISGSIFNDVNGNTNVETGEVFTGIPVPLYIYLVDANGIVVDSSHVQPDGSYALNASPYQTYSVELSTVEYPIGTDTGLTPIDHAPPSDWVTTGENGYNNSGVGDGQPDGILVVYVGGTNTNNKNFGIQQCTAAPSLLITHPSCMDVGAITVRTPVGAGYSYSVNNIDFQTSPYFSGLTAGAYTIYVKRDDNACPAISANATLTPEICVPSYCSEDLYWNDQSGAIGTYNVSTNVDNIVCTNPDIILGDIAIDEYGQMWGVSFNAGYGTLYRIDLSDCSFIPVTKTSIFAPNSLSVLPDGTLLMGSGNQSYSDNNIVYRYDPVENTFTVWNVFGTPILIGDRYLNLPSGDFIYLDGHIYVLWTNGSADLNAPRIYKVTVDENYNYISHEDLGSVQPYSYGLAKLNGELYAASGIGLETGSTDGTLIKIPLPNVEDWTVVHSDISSLFYGATSYQEAHVSELPVLSNYDISNVCPANSVNLNELNLENLLPLGAELQWFTNDSHSGLPLTPAEVANVTDGSFYYYAYFYFAGSDCYSSASAPVTVIIDSCPAISGNVFNDANGNTTTESGEEFTTLPIPLYVYLVDNNGIVVDSAHVQPDGSYELSAGPNQDYTVELSTVEYPVGTNTATTPIDHTPPAGWVTTGENADGSNDGFPDGVLSVSVGTTPVNNTNFGIQQPPVAVDDISENNPFGSPVTVDILSNDTDDTPGNIDPTTVSIVPPSGATGIVTDSEGDTVGFTIPGEGVWTVDTITGSVTFVPEPGFTGDPTPIAYTVEDNGGFPSNPATITITYADPVVITGTVFNDANGNTTTEGGEEFTTLPVPLYVYLVDNNGIVVDSAHVQPDGSYTLNASPNQDYTVELSTVEYPIGTDTSLTPIDHTPPAGWVTTGENADGSNDGFPDGILSVSVGTTPVNNTNFGIQQPPVAVNDSSNDNPYGSPVTVDVLSNDTDGTPGNIDPTTVSIVPPSGSTGIITDSEGDTIGFTIPGEGVWTVDTVTGSVTFVPEPGFTGDPTPIAYTVEDNGDFPSNPATITITYEEPIIITGTVFNDANGNTTTEGGEEFTALPVPLYVYLVDNNGIVVDSAHIQPDGSYTLNAGPNQDYTVELSTVEYPIGTDTGLTPIDHTPPAGWVTTGENADGSNDGFPDGVLSVSVGTTPVNNTNFGIQQPPVAVDDISENNPFGSPVTVDILSNDTDNTPGNIDPTTVSIVPPSGATGIVTDSEGDTIGFTVPGQGVWTVDTVTGSVTFVPEPGFTGDPTPIAYTVEDNGGFPSNPATITITYSESVTISGTVFNDMNGDVLINSGENFSGLPVPLYVYLVSNSTGIVMDSAQVAPNGSYTLQAAPNQNYALVLSQDQYAVGTNATSNPITNIPPAGWLNSGENGTNTIGGDGFPNGILSLIVNTANIQDQNFGLIDRCSIYAPGNIDSDGDGIVDRCDLDDDNDGILDTDENGCLAAAVATYPNQFFNLNPSDFGIAFNFSPQLGLNLTRDLSHKFGYDTLSGKVIVTITNANVHPSADAFYVRGDLPVTDWQVSGSIGLATAIEHGMEYFPYQRREIRLYNFDVEVDNKIPISAGSWITDEVNNVHFVTNNTANQYTGFGRGSIFTVGTLQPEMKRFGIFTNDADLDRWSTYFIRVLPECDDDMDGIPNRLDKDSDNDGCVDAIEGSGNFNYGQLNADSTLSGSVSANGIPTIAGAGQGIGTSQDSTAFDPACFIQIAGTVFNDANGNTTTEGGENFTTLPVPLYVYLVDSNGFIVDSAHVAPDGSYTLSASPNQDYTVELSTVSYPVGTNTAATPIDHTPPAGWVTTGENADGSNDGTPDGVLSVSVSTTPVSNQNFGIQQPPVAVNDSSNDNPYGLPVTVDVLSNDTDGTPGNIDPTTVSIVPPSGATGIITDSEGDTVGFTVPGEGIWTVDTVTGSVTFVPESGFTGDPTPIVYTVEDNGGFPSNPATVTITYTPIVISGIVFNDGNGNTIINAGETFTTLPAPLYVYLVDSNGIVVDSAHVQPDGTYTLNASPNQDYTIELSTVQYPVGTNTGTIPINHSLPSNWVTTGENANGTNDGIPDGIMTVSVGTGNIGNYNFGIEQRPETDTITYHLPYTPNEGSDACLDGFSAPELSGSDPEDGIYTGANSTGNFPQGVIITSLPTYGQLWYYGFGAPTVLQDSHVVNSVLLDPSLLCLVFTGCGYTGTTFEYAYVDAAGVVDSTPGTYTVTWDGIDTVTLLATPPSCLSTGTVTISSPIGSDYTYSSDSINFQESPYFPGLTAGNHTFYVRKAGNSCVSSQSITLTPATCEPSYCNADLSWNNAEGEIGTYNVNTGDYTVLCTNADIQLGDIGIDQYGQMWGVGFETDTLYRIDLSSCTFVPVTQVPVRAPNSLSILPDGTFLMGSGNPFDANGNIVHRYNPVTDAFTVWNVFDESAYPDITYPSGDYIYLDGSIYVLWFDETVDAAAPHIYKATVDANYNYISHEDLGAVQPFSYGLAKINGELYAVTSIGSATFEQTGTIIKIPLPNVEDWSVAYTDIVSLFYGATSYQEVQALDLPILSDYDISNECPEVTVDLNALLTGTPPIGYSLVWFTNDTHSGTALTTEQASNVGVGAYYYAYFYNEEADCYSPVSAPVLVTIDSCPAITGTVFHDPNGNTIINNGEYFTALPVPLYVYLVNSSGIVVDSAHVQPDGSYTLNAGPNQDYTIELSQVQYPIGTNTSTTPIDHTPPAGWVNTGENGSNNTGPGDGEPNGVLAISVGTNNVSNQNFGIQQPPVADNKNYHVPNHAFSETPPAGFPVYVNPENPAARYFAIATDNAMLTGYTHNGSLTGKDEEDCREVESCNTGSTFVLDSLYPTTVLFYNFGGEIGVRQLEPGDIIENYDPSGLVIYAIEGSGMSTPVGFTYSLVDNAGFASPPANYTIFTESALPVELLYFTATVADCKSILNWATASELNNDYFEIQRSADAKAWMTIGRIEGNGTSSARNDYNFVDNNLPGGIIYYRLKQVDYDGTTDHYNVIHIESRQCGEHQVKIYPNPASNQATIEIQGYVLNHEDRRILITDIEGRDILMLDGFSAVSKIDVSYLPAGTYFVRIFTGQELVDIRQVVVVK